MQHNPDFIAANQEDRATNVVTGTNEELIAKLRADIRAMKACGARVVVTECDPICKLPIEPRY